MKYYCLPCAEKLKSEGKPIRIVKHKTEKQTCECCGRRRYCMGYEGEKDEP